MCLGRSTPQLSLQVELAFTARMVWGMHLATRMTQVWQMQTGLVCRISSHFWPDWMATSSRASFVVKEGFQGCQPLRHTWFHALEHGNGLVMSGVSEDIYMETHEQHREERRAKVESNSCGLWEPADNASWTLLGALLASPPGTRSYLEPRASLLLGARTSTFLKSVTVYTLWNPGELKSLSGRRRGWLGLAFDHFRPINSCLRRNLLSPMDWASHKEKACLGSFFRNMKEPLQPQPLQPLRFEGWTGPALKQRRPVGPVGEWHTGESLSSEVGPTGFH